MKCIVLGREEWAYRRVDVEEALTRAGCTIAQIVPQESAMEVHLRCTAGPVKHVCGHIVEFLGKPSHHRSHLLGFEALFSYPLKCPGCGKPP